jgi:hypothetical protein
MLIVALNGSKTSKDTVYSPKLSDKATFRDVILNIRS